MNMLCRTSRITGPARWLMTLLLVLWFPLFAGAQTFPADEESSAQQRLQESLIQALQTEADIATRLQTEQEQTQKEAQQLEQQLGLYRLQASTFRNLLLVSTSAVDELNQAISRQQQTLQELSALQTRMNQEVRALQERQTRAVGRQEVYQQQVSELKNLPKESAPTELLKQADRLGRVQQLNLKTLQSLLQLQEENNLRLKTSNSENEELLQQLRTRLEERKQELLFEKQEISLAQLGPEQIGAELQRLFQLAARWSQPSQLQAGIGELWNSYRLLLVTLPLLFGIGMALLYQTKRNLLGWLQGQTMPFWQQWTLELLLRSLMPLGAVFLIWGYELSGVLANLNPLLAFFQHLLLLWLFVYWGLRALERIQHESFRPVQEAACRTLRWVRTLGLLYLLLQQLLGSNSVLLLLARVVLGVGVLVLSVELGRRLRQWIQQQDEWSVSRRAVLGLVLGSLPTLTVGGGLLLELVGYSYLGLYWSVSLSQTVIVLFWGFLCWQCLQEWDNRLEFQQEDLSEMEVNARTLGQHSTHWLIGRIGWLVWAGLVGLGFLLAWGAEKEVLLRTWGAITQPVTIGGLELSLIGFVYAFLVLLFTRILVQLWRYLFKQRLMAHSHIEEGTQESVATIGSYAIWSIGLLLGLGALGVNSSSLAVVFGAVSIGLGFGLQNIFNNFVSGLILLFERPIQVGNVVEINGIWGVVRKVNVRSTLVQTYDNASLIIPNSEFISQTVTNWSYKDPRVRRTINLGVAYGSDPEQIRAEVLQLAQQHPRVLAAPAPVVHFVDFGDSALLFRLYYHTMLDFGMSSETELRLAINRRFQELDINIPFPQQDVHFHWQEAENPAAPVPAKILENSLPDSEASAEAEAGRGTLLQQLWKPRTR